MTAEWTPTSEAADTFGRYRQALLTERELKPDVRELARAALKDGATIAQLAKATGMTPEVFRRMARDLALPVDPRYKDRAEAARKRPAVTADQPAPKPSKRPSPPAAPRFPDRVTALSASSAQRIANKAFQLAGDKAGPLTAALDQAIRDGRTQADVDRTVIAAAMALPKPLITEDDLPAAE